MVPALVTVAAAPSACDWLDVLTTDVDEKAGFRVGRCEAPSPHVHDARWPDGIRTRAALKPGEIEDPVAYAAALESGALVPLEPADDGAAERERERARLGILELG